MHVFLGRIADPGAGRVTYMSKKLYSFSPSGPPLYLGRAGIHQVLSYIREALPGWRPLSDRDIQLKQVEVYREGVAGRLT